MERKLQEFYFHGDFEFVWIMEIFELRGFELERFNCIDKLFTYTWLLFKKVLLITYLYQIVDRIF